MLRFFGVRKQFTYSLKDKVTLLTANTSINILPKKTSICAITRCKKPSGTNYKHVKVIPKYLTKYVQPTIVWGKFAQVRYFHTSNSRRAPPPLILILLRPVINIAAIIFGRSLRKWWHSLPPERKAAFISKVKKYRAYITGCVAFISLSLIHAYLSHLEQNPITNRWRFMLFSHEQMKQIADYELDVLIAEYESTFLQTNHRTFKVVASIADRILAANRDVPGVKENMWKVVVVNHPTHENAFVLPNGAIFIFTRMIDLCENEDQLGIIIAHEMSHTLLEHMAEQLSKVQMVEWMLVIPLIIIWALMPDGAAIISLWLSKLFTNVTMHLPFSRFIETEADQVGLQLAAKACFDVREAPIFWEKMARSVRESGSKKIEWLSTHPDHVTREHCLELMMPQVLKLREGYNCPPLPSLSQRKREKEEKNKYVMVPRF